MKIQLTILLLIFSFSITNAKSIRIVQVADGFDRPVDIAFDNSNTMYVVEKGGKIIAIEENGNRYTFLDIEERVKSNRSEQGLLGIALHPNFSNNGFLILHYIDLDGNSRISRFSSSMGQADPDSEELVIEIEQPFSNHNGGALSFGSDGYLYIGIGDGGGSGDFFNNAQNTDVFLGKMLRLDISTIPYAIPPDNPFLSNGNIRDEIWAIGLRNPWRFSFDQITGDLYIADVGQGTWEEVNYIENGSALGQNFGWRCYEGPDPYDTQGCGSTNDYSFPVYSYLNDRNSDGCSITGGYVYHGDSVQDLQGRYIYGDFCSGKIWALHRDTQNQWVNEEIYMVDRFELSTFGQDLSGEMYIATYNQGIIYTMDMVCDDMTFVESTPAFCVSSNEGSISITTPDPNYTYQINGGQLDDLYGGDYKVTITDSNGCSDIYRVTVDLEYEFPDLEMQESFVEVCDGGIIVMDVPLLIQLPADIEIHLYHDGIFVGIFEQVITITGGGIYSLQMVNTTNGCISGFTDILSVEVLPQPIVSINVINNQFRATTGFGTYFWYRDGELFMITGTSIIEQPEEPGTYTVIVADDNGCLSELSDPVFISQTNDPSWVTMLSVNPNPGSGIFTINGKINNSNNLDIKIHNHLGQLIVSDHIQAQATLSYAIDITDQPTGVYFISIQMEDEVAIKRVIKEK